MILGLHNMVEGIEHYWQDRSSNDGALWILALDAVLLIPAIFAMFFYPKVALIGIGTLLLLTFAGYEVVHFARKKYRR